GKRPDTTVTGFVTDVRAYYTRASVCVVPLRIARGIQNKLLEAMAMGRAVVASPAAAEGLRADAAGAIRIAADPAAMALEIVAILQSRHRAAELGRQARAYVEQEYDWDRPMRALELLLEQSARRTSGALSESPAAASAVHA